VQVHDPTDVDGAPGWLDFPPNLLVDEQEHLRPGDFLPATLLSYLLALVNAGEAESLVPLRPYWVLRRCWDDSTNGMPAGTEPDRFAAARNVRDWLRRGAVPTGAPPVVDGSPGKTESTRGEEMLATVRKARLQVTQYLPPGSVAGASFALPPVSHFEQIPLRQQLAADIHTALVSLEEIVEGAMAAASIVEDGFL